MKRQLAILGEFTSSFEPHAATNAAIAHACAASGLDVRASWISTEAIDETLFDRFHGIWVAPGSPYKNMAKTLWAIRQARENGVPCFGTCGGFQHIILEYARNVLGLADAQHAEYDPYASRLFISRLACSLVGREMELRFQPDSQVARIYGSTQTRERYYCNFGVAPDAVELLKSGPLLIVGSDAEGEVRVIELPGHPFFVGTLFVPQTLSTPERPHPLVTALLTALAEPTGNSLTEHDTFRDRSGVAPSVGPAVRPYQRGFPLRSSLAVGPDRRAGLPLSVDHRIAGEPASALTRTTDVTTNAQAG